MSYQGPTPFERRALTLAVLREHGTHMTSAQIAARIGCGIRQLTGDTAGTLLLLAEEGLVGRIGRTKGTKWYASS